VLSSAHSLTRVSLALSGLHGRTTPGDLVYDEKKSEIYLAPPGKKFPMAGERHPCLLSSLSTVSTRVALRAGLTFKVEAVTQLWKGKVSELWNDESVAKVDANNIFAIQGLFETNDGKAKSMIVDLEAPSGEQRDAIIEALKSLIEVRRCLLFTPCLAAHSAVCRARARTLSSRRATCSALMPTLPRRCASAAAPGWYGGTELQSLRSCRAALRSSFRLP
jgi:hypothetical protein